MVEQEKKQYKIFDRKVIIQTRYRLCEQIDEVLESSLFQEIIIRSIEQLKERNSILLKLFGDDYDARAIGMSDVTDLINTLKYLPRLDLPQVSRLLPEAQRFIGKERSLFQYIEYLYNFWRHFDRFIICNSEGDSLDKRPYRTFNATIEMLNHLVLRIYRDIQEKLSTHPRVYRQLHAGAEMAGIAIPKDIPFDNTALLYAQKLNFIPVLRQILLNPPIVLETHENKRTGAFTRVYTNPLDVVQLQPEEWLCYPAKVGELLILTYVHESFYELGFALANLFEIAADADLEGAPHVVFLYGVPGEALDKLASQPIMFYDDEKKNMLVAAIPNRQEFSYFGYLKKMILTLHNIICMKQGLLPFHGSLTQLYFKDGGSKSVLIIGDSGAGKSETLEALQNVGSRVLSDIVVIADDMGHLKIQENENEIVIQGVGTEIGAFLRLDDLSPASTFNNIDRSIFINTTQVNSRVLIPIADYQTVCRGVPIDYILYANNYEPITPAEPVFEQFHIKEHALKVFQEGKSMAKGTTSATGLQSTYFVNIFGPPEYRDLHETIAHNFFTAMLKAGVFIGQLRTQLGIPGMEKEGPRLAAEFLLERLKTRTIKEKEKKRRDQKKAISA